MRTVWRYEIPIDDKAHAFELSDYPTRVQTRLFTPSYFKDKGWYLEFWAMHDSLTVPMRMMLKVCGTGYEIPENGYVLATSQPLHGRVFHLIELQGE